MATVVLQAAGQGIGAFLGGPIGGIIGRAAGAIAGNIIDQSLFGSQSKSEGPRLTDLRVMSSSEASAIPRLWGRMRVAGQVIWATNFEEVSGTRTEGGSSKGGGGTTKVTEYTYYANFAVALCEGEIDGIGRVWADGKDFDITGLTVRIYTGTETQNADSLIIAKEGAANAPAYRGIAYVVFERLDVTQFGNRMPQLSFEVLRAAGGAAGHVRAVNIIPGSTEFGYDTVIVTREVEEGEVEAENAHASDTRSNWTVSLDQLTSTCRNLEAASLVVAWFGDDLRCATCQVRPGVEVGVKVTDPETWVVNGIARAAAHLVSTSGGGPAYGGTPSDASVIRALQDISARGLKTVFYPFVMMDIPPGNAKPDPYGGSEQAVYPWRGRITASIAPGRAGTPDKTAACAAEIGNFLGNAQPSHFDASGMTVNYSGPAGWGYRRMVLHYAKLCAAAGGVDAFLIASELRGLTGLRGASSSFPFVAGLVTLAAEVKAILPGAKVSYAADWSEYFGYQPGDGSNDVFFHLDPLWASPSVGFVGIDNYMPLSDWRDGRQHADYLAGTKSIYDTDYLKSGIAGGEGFDWYYASEANRETQNRSAITDGAYGKPWVFRYKDVKSWWSNQHFDRPAGTQSPAPTGWVPQSKPIWFTEAGCAAIDKGANLPNAFVDAKSAENLLPHFSTGQRDDLMQSRYIVALGEYWPAPGSHNPDSTLYAGRMVDAGRIFLWSWDARPFPHFPALAGVWADSANYSRGHWLNGRIAGVPLGGLIQSICQSFGFDDIDAGGVEGLIDGFAIDRGMSVRDALEGLLQIHGIDAVESGGLIRFAMRRHADVTTTDLGQLVEADAQSPLYLLKRTQETELPAAVKLSYIESARDYRIAAVEARHLGGSSLRDVLIDLPCATDQAQAQVRADISLQESWAAREGAEFGLPPSALALEPGDVVALQRAIGSLLIRIDEVADGLFRKMRGRSFDPLVFDASAGPARDPAGNAARIFGKPNAVIMDLPLTNAGSRPHAPWIVASAKPWPGVIAVYRRTGAASFALNRLITSRATQGRTLTDLTMGPLHMFDRANSLTVKLGVGALASVSETELLLGANAAAVGSSETGWEIIQFRDAELIAERTYKLSYLLRGQSGSGPEMLALRAAGMRFVFLNAAAVQLQLSLAEAGLSNTWRIGPARYDIGRSYPTIEHTGKKLGLRPLSPCHLRATRTGGSVAFNWIRRTRAEGDSWDVAEVPLGEDQEAYVVEIRDGPTLKRSTQTSTPDYLYSAGGIAADFGSDPGVFTLHIAQLSTVYGRGSTLQGTIHV